jgi:hypothetical protein
LRLRAFSQIQLPELIFFAKKIGRNLLFIDVIQVQKLVYNIQKSWLCGWSPFRRI